MPDSDPARAGVEDPRLTATERAALERLVASAKKGGEGYHRDSVDAVRVRRLLETGTADTPADEELVCHALRMAERSERV